MYNIWVYLIFVRRFRSPKMPRNWISQNLLFVFGGCCLGAGELWGQRHNVHPFGSFGTSRESILYHFPFRSSVHVHWNSHVTNAKKNRKGRVCIKFGWLEGERCVTSFEKNTNYTNYIGDFLKKCRKYKAACTIGIDWLTDCLPGCWVARLLGCLIPPFIGLCFLAGLIEWWLG